MIELTEEMQSLMDNALLNGTPCVLTTSSLNGDLTIGFRGSMMVWQSDCLAYWERGKGQSLDHLENGGNAAVILRNPELRKGWKFFGKGTVLRDGPVREAIMGKVVKPEMDRDPEQEGFAVILTLDRVEDLGGKPLMAR